MSCETSGPNPVVPTPPVIPHQISRVVRNAVYQRFIDPDIGFNPLIAYQNYRYDLRPPIAFVSTTGDCGGRNPNFIFGQINVMSALGTSAFKFPLIAMYSHGILNRNWIKYRQFSGQVVLGIDVWYSWRDSNLRDDYETYGDAIEEVVVEIVNGFGASGIGDVTQSWGNGIVYNGNVSCSRTPVEADAENWLQGYQFRFTFHVDTDVP